MIYIPLKLCKHLLFSIPQQHQLFSGFWGWIANASSVMLLPARSAVSLLPGSFLGAAPSVSTVINIRLTSACMREGLKQCQHRGKRLTHGLSSAQASDCMLSQVGCLNRSMVGDHTIQLCFHFSRKALAVLLPGTQFAFWHFTFRIFFPF